MLILKGEPFPPPRFSSTAMPAADGSTATLLPASSGTALLPSVAADAGLPGPAQFFVKPNPSPYRALSAGAAEYARTQNLSGDRTRSQLIDTYA